MVHHRCGGRDTAFEVFKTALETYPDAFLVLLVDSEAPSSVGAWQHLRAKDGWEPGICRTTTAS